MFLNLTTSDCTHFFNNLVAHTVVSFQRRNDIMLAEGIQKDIPLQKDELHIMRYLLNESIIKGVCLMFWKERISSTLDWNKNGSVYFYQLFLLWRICGYYFIFSRSEYFKGLHIWNIHTLCTVSLLLIFMISAIAREIVSLLFVFLCLNPDISCRSILEHTTNIACTFVIWHISRIPFLYASNYFYQLSKIS